jgi:hypothetical protein
VLPVFLRGSGKEELQPVSRIQRLFPQAASHRLDLVEVGSDEKHEDDEGRQVGAGDKAMAARPGQADPNPPSNLHLTEVFDGALFMPAKVLRDLGDESLVPLALEGLDLLISKNKSQETASKMSKRYR